MKLEWIAKANGRTELWTDNSTGYLSKRQLGFVRGRMPGAGGEVLEEKRVAVQAPRSAKMRKWFNTEEEAKAWLTCVVRLS